MRKYKDYHKEISEILYKRCIDCDEWIIADLEHFGRDNNTKSKFNDRCKVCQKKYNKIYYAKTRDHQKEKARQWKREHPEKYYTEKYQKTKKAYDAKRSTKLRIKENSRRSRENGLISEWVRKNPEKQKQYTLKRKYKEHEISEKQWRACKEFFGNACAYCGLPIENHFKKYRGILRPQDLHKEHVDDKGSNSISNCVPSCHTCNSEKHTDSLDNWYKQQEFFTEERYNKILYWINEGYKEFIEDMLPYRIVRKRNEGLTTYHYQLWKVDEDRRMIKCVDIKDKRKDLDLSLIL